MKNNGFSLIEFLVSILLFLIIFYSINNIVRTGIYIFKKKGIENFYVVEERNFFIQIQKDLAKHDIQTIISEKNGFKIVEKTDIIYYYIKDNALVRQNSKGSKSFFKNTGVQRLSVELKKTFKRHHIILHIIFTSTKMMQKDYWYLVRLW